IRRRGVFLAQRLGAMIQRIEKAPVPVGSLDITLYRDDLSTLGPKPVVQKSEIGIPITGKDIILVDDVLYTGRTTRAAMDALFTHGRPRRIQLCVFVDRGHRELPIEATFVGRKIPTSPNESILVQLREVDEADKVLLVDKRVLLLFYEASTRTRSSFEVAAKSMGAMTTLVLSSGSSIEKGESLLDTGYTLRAVGADVIVIRHPSAGAPQLMAQHLDIPVINAGDGMHEHPSQALLDAYTILRHKKVLKGLHIAIIGDI